MHITLSTFLHLLYFRFLRCIRVTKAHRVYVLELWKLLTNNWRLPEHLVFWHCHWQCQWPVTYHQKSSIGVATCDQWTKARTATKLKRFIETRCWLICVSVSKSDSTLCGLRVSTDHASLEPLRCSHIKTILLLNHTCSRFDELQSAFVEQPPATFVEGWDGTSEMTRISKIRSRASWTLDNPAANQLQKSVCHIRPFYKRQLILNSYSGRFENKSSVLHAQIIKLRRTSDMPSPKQPLLGPIPQKYAVLITTFEQPCQNQHQQARYNCGQLCPLTQSLRVWIFVDNESRERQIESL